MGILSTIGSFLFGNSAGSVVETAANIIGKHIVDKDKKSAAIVSVIEAYQTSANTKTMPWADAIHKLGRQLLQFLLIGFYIYAWHIGKTIPIADLITIAAGPGLYTLMKGKGQ